MKVETTERKSPAVLSRAVPMGAICVLTEKTALDEAGTYYVRDGHVMRSLEGNMRGTGCFHIESSVGQTTRFFVLPKGTRITLISEA